MEKKIEVLEFVTHVIKYGGIETVLINLYKNIDHTRFHITICTPGVAENEILKNLLKEQNEECIAYNYILGKNRVKFTQLALKDILKKKKFDIIHIHSGLISQLYFSSKTAKKFGRGGKVILHSHCTGVKTLGHTIKKFYTDLTIDKYVDKYLACSKPAGEWTFPKKILSTKKFDILNNGIDTNAFKFDEKIREEYRKNLDLKDKFTLCHVGRFGVEKNHKFLFDVLSLLNKKNFDFKCLLVGDGSIKEEMQNKAKLEGFSDKVLFLNKRDDVPSLLCASDLFLFPSIYEGLGIVAIESQASGLKILCSANIPNEAFLTDIIKKLPFDKELWAEEIEKASKEEKFDRTQFCDIVDLKDFGVKGVAKKLENIYEEEYKKQ